MVGSKILVGTKGSEIYEIRAPTEECELYMNLHHGALVQGHYRQQLWGLAFPPKRVQNGEAQAEDAFSDLFATTGDDKTLRVWHAGTKRVVAATVGPA